MNKEQEREYLDYFLRARQSAIGEKLTLVCDSEAPDFICCQANGELVGVEHTSIVYQPEQDELRDLCRDFDPDSDNFEILWASTVALAKKEAKRRRDHWKLPTRTILVFDLLSHFRFEDWPADESLSDDFSDTGFIEVWISDHASIGTHGEVTAIGLFPKQIWVSADKDIFGRHHINKRSILHLGQGREGPCLERHDRIKEPQ